MKKIVIILSILFSLSSIKEVKAIEGIDVSEWQGTINFNEVREDNIEIVYIRSSAGNSYIDARFEENYRNAKNANLKIGFYHYLTARNTEEAREQARFFANVIANKSPDCRLAMDFEALKGLSNNEINEIARAFLQELTSLTDKEVVIYSDAFNAARVFDQSLFDTYPLWVAEYGVETPEAENYIGWQYTDEGRVSGINAYVDRDNFKEEIYLNDSTPIIEPSIPIENQSKIIYYRVKRGDTLTKIARTYDTTLSSILSLNTIPNPNLIFPNEIIKIETNYKYNITNNGKNTTYIVKRGDTLTRIARLYNTTIANLVTWNSIKNPNLIYPGEKIIIKPRNNDHTIRYLNNNNESLNEIATFFEVSLFELNQINKGNTKEIYIPETYILED